MLFYMFQTTSLICFKLILFHLHAFISIACKRNFKMSAPSEVRTHDPWFTRPVLLPLSYGGTCDSSISATDTLVLILDANSK
jgi:hypothetical protein